MGDQADIGALAGQLGAAVELTMNPQVPMDQRHRAFTQLEEFKENSPYGSQCGFYLVTHSQAPVARHFGLKLLEDVVKARWNSMVAEEKIFIKENLMKLMSSGTGHLTVEHLFMKDALARVVVELVKREWPQQWPGLLSELDSLCQQGETQTELVMFVLLRLVEDVAVLQTLEQSQRRKEIYSALTANMEQIFSFLLGLLEKHYRAYKESGSDEHCRVCTATLNTFGALVEWVNIQHSMANDKYLLRCLTHLLSDPRLQLSAGDCLLGLVGWRAGKTAERAHLLCLFDTDMMMSLFAATEEAEKKSLDCDHYTFLKRMVEILTVLGDQVCCLWTKETPRSSLPNLSTYLDALLAFTRHPSQTVSHLANELWAKFFRHPDIGADPVFLSYRPKWLDVALRKAVKVGYPEKDDHPACSYSQLDYDNDEEFHGFFVKYRLCIVENVRVISASNPLMPLSLLDRWLREVLSTSPPSLLDLEAISNLLDSTFSKLTEPEQVQPVSHLAVPLLQLVLTHPATSPLLVSELLSCISALFSCIHLAPSALQPVLSKVFAPLAAPNTDNSKDVRTLRRHACALLVKLGSKFPTLLLPTFDFLRAEIARLNSTCLVSKMEYVTLTEGLVVISNQMCDYNKQSSFIQELLAPIVAQLAQLQPKYSSPEELLSHVGLTQPPTVAEAGDTLVQNRSLLIMLLNTFLAVTRRAAAPQDSEAAARGGFVVSQPGQGKVVRNPCGSQVCAALPNLLLLAQTLNKMLNIAARARLDPGYVKVMDMLVVDRNNILGLPGSRSARNEVTYSIEKLPEPVMRMQNFVTEMFENLQHLLSYFSTNIGVEFYQQPNLGRDLCLSSLSNLPGLPDFRLRAINKMFLKNFVACCPTAQHSTVLLPVLAQMLPFMLTHMTERWAEVKRMRESPGFDEDNTDSQEVLEDVVLRVTAREYLDTVRTILTSGGSPSPSTGEDSQSEAGTGGGMVVTALGEAVLAAPTLCQPLTLILLAGIAWPDSPSSAKAAGLVELVLPKLLELGTVKAEDANGLMVKVLQAFQEMGHHEANNIALTHLALLCYEKLRCRFESVRDVLAQVPNCQPEDLQKFDAKIMAQALNPAAKTGEKAKKDMFRKMISSLQRKETAKMFQKEIVIKNLPNLVPSKMKAKTPSLDEQTERNGQDTGLATLFAQ